MPHPEITALEASGALAGYRVIDVREDYEFRGPLGCIECAELLPLGSIEAHAERLAGSRLLLVCRSGRRSGVACEKLAALGCNDVTNLAGGMICWNRARLPVLQAQPDSLAALVDQVVGWTAQVGPLTVDAARAIVRERFRRHSVTYEDPSRAAVAELIAFVAESLAPLNPPDLDLSLASFRRSLAAL